MKCIMILFPILFLLLKSEISFCGPLMYNVYTHDYQDDEGDNAFHIAADTARMIRENLEWLIVMLRNPNAAVEVRNLRQVADKEALLLLVDSLIFSKLSHLSNLCIYLVLKLKVQWIYILIESFTI
jgi:hypothetical protein